MPTINVAKPFDYTHANGQNEKFTPGQYDVPLDIADHWYTKLHLVGAKSPAPVPGTPEYSQMEARRQHRQRMIDEMSPEERAEFRALMDEPKEEQSGESPVIERKTLDD